MTPEMEQKVLSSLYDRLYDAITYTPSKGSAPFDAATTFMQFSKNEPLNPKDFANMATPANPGGSLNSSELFARMVDVVPAIQADYTPTANNVSTVYANIVNGANSDAKIDPGQKQLYEQAYHFLNETTKVKDFTGKEVDQTGPSPIYQTYLNNRSTYIAAVSGYRSAYLGYDMSKPADQRAWQANEPTLQSAVTNAYNTWRAQGAAQVEQALAAINTTINSSIRNALSDAQAAIAPANQMAPSLPGAGNWFLTVPLPTNFADPDAAQNFTELTLSSSYLNETASSEYTSYGGGASWSAGLWSVGGSFSHSSGSESYHMDANSMSLSAKIGVVRVLRPWLHEFIFRMNGWWVDSTGKNGISNGALKGNSGGLLPLIPTAFVVARDIEISADFTSEDKTHIESATSGSARVGWGPFSISGHYSHSSSNDTFTSTFDGGTLKVPGIQILAWASEIVPASPPMDKPAAKNLVR